MVLFSDEENGSQFVDSQSENNIESQKTATEDIIKQGKNTTYFVIIFNDINDMNESSLTAEQMFDV